MFRGNYAKYCRSLLAGLLAAGLLLAGCGIPPNSRPFTEKDGVITLKFADQNAPEGWGVSQTTQPWLDLLEKTTGGQIRIEPYFSQSLVKGADAWDATRSGITDMAWLFHGYWADRTPLANVISLPMLPFTSSRQASGILWHLYQQFPRLREQFSDNHILLVWASSPYFLATTQKQVKTLDDIRGLKIRVPTGPPVKAIQTLGAEPLSIGMPDVYLYLEKGALDGIATSWESLLSFRQFDLLKYYTYLPLFTVYFSIAVNHNVWRALPPDIRHQFNSLGGLAYSLNWGENYFDRADAEGRDAVLAAGAEIIDYVPVEEEMARWTEMAMPLWDDWVKKMNAAGFTEAQVILDTTLKLIETYHP
ncbi:MAG TPA: TRAP transporter substrate-binding protein [Dehalococcoidales bacterium]|nr:TRAP transporter substrate-binding protein [Dehalococcoidales bacterium]